MNLKIGDRVQYNGHSEHGKYVSEGVIYREEEIVGNVIKYHIINERDNLVDIVVSEDIIQVLP